MLAAVSGVAIVARMIERRLDAMSLAQMRILTLVERDPARASAVAERAALSRPTLSGMIDGLAARGWIDRCTVDGDRRGVTLSITPDGAAALARAQRESARALEELLEEMSPARRTSALHALANLSSAAEVRHHRKLIRGEGDR